MCIICDFTKDSTVDIPATLVIEGCRELTIIPSLDGLIELRVVGCNALYKINRQPCLIHLTIEKCPHLRSVATIPQLERLELYDSNIEHIQWMPRLSTVRLERCEHILRLPPKHTNIRHLFINDCPNIDIPNYSSIVESVVNK